jgi:anaerobic ribonucleoside-triphosphate reductase activating protein
MLRFVNYDIVFQEVPDEVTLAINISNCPNCCQGCHSPWLREDIGEELSEKTLVGLLEKYGYAITCVCFMGGDAAPVEVDNMAAFLRRSTKGRIRTAWYSGRQKLPSGCYVTNFNYIKLGPYIEELGGLRSPATNQRFYRIENGAMVDITECFRRGSR